MASEVQGSASAGAAEVQDLTAKYAKKKRELTTQNEQALRELETKYRTEAQTESESGKAVVNHIRESNAREITDIKDHHARAYGELRKNNAEKIAQQRDVGDDSRNIYNQKKHELIVRNEEALKNLKADYKREIGEETKSGDAALKQVREHETNEISDLHHQFQSTHQSIQKENVEAVQKEREYGENTVRNTADKYHREYEKQKDLGESRIQDIQKQSADHVKMIRETSVEREKRLRDQYQKEFDQTINFAETRKAATETQNKSEVEKLTTDHEQKIETENKQYALRMNELTQTHENAVKTQKEGQNKARFDQDHKFETAYQKADQANQTSFTRQREAAAQAYEKLKTNYALKSEGTLALSEDEFYKIEPSRSALEETTDSYLLRIPVSDHERDHVKVRVEDAKASVIGTRQFQQNVAEPNRKLSSSSYQTYREEFHLEKPIRAAGVERRDLPGLIEVRIPKI